MESKVDGFREGSTKCQRAMEADVNDRASPVWIAGHEVPPTSPVGVSKVDGNRLTAFFESAFCFDVAVEWSMLLHLLCRAFDRLIGRG